MLPLLTLLFYCLHLLISSTIKYGLHSLQTSTKLSRDDSAEQRIHEITNNSMGRSFSPKPPHSPPIDEQKSQNVNNLSALQDDTFPDTPTPTLTHSGASLTDASRIIHNIRHNISNPTTPKSSNTNSNAKSKPKAPSNNQQSKPSTKSTINTPKPKVTIEGKTKSKTKGAKIKYIGKREDEEWWKKIDKLEIGNGKDDQDSKDKLNQGFGELVSKMGIFRYQSSHGFRTGQNRGLNHLKSKWTNIKQEVLNNSFHALSNDNWNQTLRKSKVFYQSWARHKIRTVYAGSYSDMIVGKTETWNKGEDITLQEIVTLKLYTDFDKLQFELKKCFRWETIVDIWIRDQRRADKQTNDEHEMKKNHEFLRDSERQKAELEKRLCEFFNWRFELVVVLNKFGLKMSKNHTNKSNNNLVLYHGVNAKMILNPTETLQFFGPLSTTSSYHVAKTFATDKGMILKITTHYPRLGTCKAFNASLISDYPEEQEWLIGFIYLRVLEIRTVALNFDNWINIPLASIIRSIFFSINLFRECCFSMSAHLEYHLKAFLKQIVPGNYDDEKEIEEHKEDKLDFATYLRDNIVGKDNTKTIKKKADQDDESFAEDVRRLKITTILWRKFTEFRQEPNLPQIIKIDKISSGLKPYFLDFAGLDIRKEKKWKISFEKNHCYIPKYQRNTFHQ